MSDNSYTPRTKPRPREGLGATAAAMACTTTRARSEIVAEVCERIAAGESVESMLTDPGKPGDYPSLRTFRYWCADDPEVIPHYDRAMQARAVRGAEEIEAIADDAPERISITDGEGKVVGSRVDPGFEQWRKTRIDARKWNAAKLLPKKYGDRTIISGDADNPIEHRLSVASRLLPELAAGDANQAIEGVVTGGSGRAELRVERLLGPHGATAADDSMDVLADHGGTGIREDT